TNTIAKLRGPKTLIRPPSVVSSPRASHCSSSVLTMPGLRDCCLVSPTGATRCYGAACAAGVCGPLLDPELANGGGRVGPGAADCTNLERVPAALQMPVGLG